MNAEDCAKHRHLIDQPGEEGIYYPWVCECPYPDHEHDWVKPISGWDAWCDICGQPGLMFPTRSGMCIVPVAEEEDE